MQTTAEPPARLHNSCMLHKDQAASHEATLNRSQNTTYNFHVCGKKTIFYKCKSAAYALPLCLFRFFYLLKIKYPSLLCVLCGEKSEEMHLVPDTIVSHMCLSLCVWVPVCVLCVLRFSVVFTCNTGLFQPPAGV